LIGGSLLLILLRPEEAEDIEEVLVGFCWLDRAGTGLSKLEPLFCAGLAGLGLLTPYEDL